MSETVEHEVEDTKTCCCFPAYRFTVTKPDGTKKSRLACRSFPLHWAIVSTFFIYGGIICGVDVVVRGPLMEFSVGESSMGILSLKAGAPLWMTALLRFQSPLGGGVELVMAMVFALIFLPRSRFFYYMTVSGLQQVITLQLRMLLGDPRPFMVSDKISPWTCYNTFGNPGDHSISAVAGAIVIFLDIFHGTPIKFSYAKDSIFHGWCLYVMSILFALYWCITMPFSRYLGGIQSLDQLLFGAAIGVWLGIWSHFVMRDHLIGFFEQIIHWQNESKGLLNFTKEKSDAPDPEQPELEEIGLEEVHAKTLSGQAKDDEKEFSPGKFILICIVLWLLVIIGATVSYFYQNTILGPESPSVVQWLNNMEHHNCGKYTFDESFHNKMFPSAGIITFHIASMIIFTQRKRIGIQLCYNYKLQDGSSLFGSRQRIYYMACTRIVVFSLLFGIYALADQSGKAMKKKEASPGIGSKYLIMFETVIYPLLIIAYLLNSGIYDLLVSGIQRWCITSTEE